MKLDWIDDAVKDDVANDIPEMDDIISVDPVRVVK